MGSFYEICRLTSCFLDISQEMDYDYRVIGGYKAAEY
jgi:hypothetical protein